MWDESVDGQDDAAPWLDRAGISILVYAVFANVINVVQEVLTCYDSKKSHLLAWRLPGEGVAEIGLPGLSTCLHGAMNFASAEVVVALLESGAGPDVTDITGTDVFMGACAFGRLDNVMMWCSRFKNWNIDQKNEKFGSTALHVALYMGPRKIDIIKYLVRYIYSSIFHYELYSYNSFQNTSHETLVSKPDSRQKG